MSWLFDQARFSRPIDAAVAAMLARRWPHLGPDLLGVFALASQQAGQGHGALDLTALISSPDRQTVPPAISISADLLAKVRGCSIVDDGSGDRPFVFDDDLLYLRRFHRDEVCLADLFRELAVDQPDRIDRSRIMPALAALFPDVEDPIADPRSLACLVSATSRLTVVLGGPGTGKTTVVARLLSLHQRLADQMPRIAVAAPTGKAAARVGEAMAVALDRIAAGAGRDSCPPVRAMTLHRLLGARPDGVQFRHGADERLPFDIVVVDEASMIDQSLFRRLLESLPDAARLVVLGDPDQLEAIESGAVLSELSKLSGNSPNRAAETRARSLLAGASENSGTAALQACVVRLERNWRFSPDSGIGRLTHAIRIGDPETAVALLTAGLDDLAFADSRGMAASAEIAAFVRDRYRDAFDTGDPDEMLRSHAGFRVLAATRVDVSRANLAAAHALGQRLRQTRPEQGMPFIIERNDALRRLYNGDTGVFCRDPDEQLRAYLASDAEGSSSGAKAQSGYAVGEIGRWLPAYAMTVHRAQGAEYDDVLVSLPVADSRVLSRSWLYTAVSRARRRLFLHGSLEAIAAAIARPLTRTSGLALRLLR